jgi:hypothetical protein
MTTHVLSAIRDKRAEIAKALRQAEKHILTLHEDLAHLDHAARLFDPAAKARAQSPCAFKRGHFHRTILNVLREASAPMSPRAVAERLVADRPEIIGKSRTMGDLAARVRRSLGRNHAGLTGEKASRWDAKAWRVDEAAD